MARPIMVLNGPNLNKLGTREPKTYGTDTLEEIENACRLRAEHHGLEAICHQTNHEGAMIDALHDADQAASGVVLNAGAYTHTSVALHDAIRSISVPVIEVHLSNPHARETFRHHSFIAPVAQGSISGLGMMGYKLAIDALADIVLKGNH